MCDSISIDVAANWRRWAPRVIWLSGLLVTSACGLGDSTFEAAAPGAIPQAVTYRKHIAPRIEYYCLGCHNTDGPLGNAGDWNFESYDLVKGGIDAILFASFDEKTMPPGGSRRMTPRDGAIFRRWRDGGFAK